MYIKGRNILDVYPQLLDRILENGSTTTPRGQEVVEHDGVISWTLENPWEWVLFIPGRRLNPFFALAEVVWMWSGKGGIDFISYYNSSMKNFADDNIPYFNAAYGKRIRHAGYDERPFREIPFLVTPGLSSGKVDVDQIDYVIRKLKTDPQTRQAAISLWDPVKDNITKSKDHPCNNMVYFSWRGHVPALGDDNPGTKGKLNITVVIRSNDLIWGVPYNMIQFVHLQALIAGSIGAEMGTFTVMCNNLHFYTQLYKPTLDTVIEWTQNLSKRRVSTDRVSDGMFANWTSELMIWDIDRFDGFVRNIWDYTDAELRQGFLDGAKAVWYNMKWFKFQDLMVVNRVPLYWRMVFTVMFMFHVRKAKMSDVYDSMIASVPQAVLCLINDFNNKG